MILYYFLMFCAGICLHMSVLHFFHFAETAKHPMIRIWKHPRTASALWGSFQLACGLIIPVAYSYRLSLAWDSFFAFLGFCAWGVLRGRILDRKALRDVAVVKE